MMMKSAYYFFLCQAAEEIKEGKSFEPAYEALFKYLTARLAFHGDRTIRQANDALMQGAARKVVLMANHNSLVCSCSEDCLGLQ
jgi:hypothetical protein